MCEKMLSSTEADTRMNSYVDVAIQMEPKAGAISASPFRCKVRTRLVLVSCSCSQVLVD